MNIPGVFPAVPGSQLGGGEGRSSGGRHPVTPWGKPTKGYKTRMNKRTDGQIIRRRDKGKG